MCINSFILILVGCVIKNLHYYCVPGGVPQIYDSEGGHQVCADHSEAGHGGEAFRKQCGGGDHDSRLHVPHVHPRAARRGY